MRNLLIVSLLLLLTTVLDGCGQNIPQPPPPSILGGFTMHEIARATELAVTDTCTNLGKSAVVHRSADTANIFRVYKTISDCTLDIATECTLDANNMMTFDCFLSSIQQTYSAENLNAGGFQIAVFQ